MQQIITHRAALTVRPEHQRNVGREIEKRIRDRSARLCVLGLGYVGLPLAVEMAKEGFRVTGIDIDSTRVESVNCGQSYLTDVPNESLRAAVNNGTLRATQSFAALESVDAI